MRDVTAAILLRDGAVLIAQRPPHDKHGGLWEFPGGKVEAGERPEDGLARELREELGITARVGEFLGESVYHYGHGCIRLLAYRVFWEEGEIRPAVHQEVRFVAMEELAMFAFTPADLPFVRGLREGSLPLR